MLIFIFMLRKDFFENLFKKKKNIVNCIIQNCGTKFWHCMLPSCTLLLKDFIVACANIDKEVFYS